MARGRKPAKRVRIEIEVDMTDSNYKDLKAGLREWVNSGLIGTIVFLAIGAEDRE